MAPQGKNITADECSALQAELGEVTWELAADEYKKDLAQPEFLLQLQEESKPPPVQQQPVVDPESPATDGQWERISKSVAWLGLGL